jgi:hypothetical protein
MDEKYLMALILTGFILCIPAIISGALLGLSWGYRRIGVKGEPFQNPRPTLFSWTWMVFTMLFTVAAMGCWLVAAWGGVLL